MHSISFRFRPAVLRTLDSCLPCINAHRDMVVVDQFSAGVKCNFWTMVNRTGATGNFISCTFRAFYTVIFVDFYGSKIPTFLRHIKLQIQLHRSVARRMANCSMWFDGGGVSNSEDRCWAARGISICQCL